MCFVSHTPPYFTTSNASLQFIYLLSKRAYHKTQELTSEISSSGCINLLVALVVVSVAGLLVTVAGGLATVLLGGLAGVEEEEGAGAAWV